MRRYEGVRETGETRVAVTLVLDGTGTATVSTGIGFLDHMVRTLCRYARFDATIQASGDLVVDDHHTAEDVALSLGAAIDQALGERRGINRFGHGYAPLDEALARAVVDLSGRPWPVVELQLQREMLGGLATENVTHFFNSLAIAARASMHIDVIRGKNDHHKAEAAFKALGLALRIAVARDGTDTVPSEKGTLT